MHPIPAYPNAAGPSGPSVNQTLPVFLKFADNLSNTRQPDTGRPTFASIDYQNANHHWSRRWYVFGQILMMYLVR